MGTVDLVRRCAASALLTALLTVTSGCFGRYIQLKVPETERAGGTGWVCETTEESKANCKPESALNPADLNHSGSVFIILPPECHGLLNALTIEDAGTSKPKARLFCGAAENHLQ